MSRRLRLALAHAVIVAAAVAIFGGPLLRREVFTFRDHSDYFQPLRLYTAQHLRAGRLPLWNPYSGSGEPWLANPQTGIFYPPVWLFRLLDFPTAYVAFLFLHALVLGSGALLLFARRVGLPAALLGAVGLMTSGPVLSLLDVSNNFTSFAWVPWVLLAAESDRDHPRSGVSGLALTAAFLGGEPLIASIAAVMYCAIVRRPAVIAATGGWAAGLSAVQLLPFLELVRGSDRLGGFEPSDILRASMRFADWVRLAVPPRFAAPTQEFIVIVYVGVFVVALAVGGVAVLVQGRQWPLLAGWVGVIAASALVASGPQWLAQLPVTILRYPARVVPFAALALAALAAFGWQRLRRGSVIADAVVIAAIVADLAVASAPILRTRPFARGRVPYEAGVGRDRKIFQDYRDGSLRGGGRAAWVAGYLNLLELRFSASTAAPLSSTAYMRLYSASLENLDLLRKMGVGWVLTTARLGPPFEPVARAQAVRAYRLAQAYPMAYLTTPEGGMVPAKALALDASSARVAVDAPVGGMLVLTQNDAPGWKVTVNGSPAESERAFGTFRAVRVPPGRHTVVWNYMPLSLIAGAVVTSITLSSLALIALRKRSFAP